MSFITGLMLTLTLVFGLIAFTGIAEFLVATTPFFFMLFLLLAVLSIYVHLSDGRSRKI